jgi:hypothetical protein
MKKYTVEQLEFLRTKYPLMRIPELTAAFNTHFGMVRTETAIKSACNNHKFICGRALGNPVGTLIAYTQEQAQFIRDNYTRLSIPDLTIKFNARFQTNRTAGHLRAFTGNHKIRSGRTGCFAKGYIPANKGTKGLTHANITSFKKGNNPPNRKPMGHQRICSKDGYILVKVPQDDPYTGFPSRYRPKHIVIWEEANGQPVPPGMAVAFKDGDRTNCILENFMLVSRHELLQLNQHHYRETPDELKPNVLAVAKLEAKVRKRKFA